MNKPNNPPAFPSHHANSIVQGMTLRDWFAGMALQSDTGEQGEWPNNETHARWAYAMADAMLTAREKESQ
jgi:hypothetical protein